MTELQEDVAEERLSLADEKHKLERRLTELNTVPITVSPVESTVFPLLSPTLTVASLLHGGIADTWR